jgi:molybdate transport system ATP-binding protein
MPSLSLDIAVERRAFELRVQVELPLQGITAVFGPSGAGKTTLLRAIAGLERDTSGRIAFDGAVWQDGSHRMAPHARRTGYVFQDGRLFGHLTVDRNLRYAARRATRSGPGTPLAYDDVVRALSLSELLGRRPAELSSGEQQRAAIGRALVGRPRLLLMDEPLSSLDLQRKREIVPLIERLPEAFGSPVLYVTHNLDEVTRLASHVLLLAAGRVAGYGETTEVLQRVDMASIAGDAEAGVVLSARVVDQRGGVAMLGLGRQALVVPLTGVRDGAVLRVRVHASDVAIATVRPERISIRNVLEASIVSIDTGSSAEIDVQLDLDGQRLRARLTRAAVAELALAPGMRVYALVKSVALENTLLG